MPLSPPPPKVSPPPLRLSRHRKQQEIKLQNKRKIQMGWWGERSSGSMICSCWMLTGWRRSSMRSYFPKRSSLRKGYRAWLLFKIDAVGDEEENEIEWYEIMRKINLLKILFVRSSFFIPSWRPAPPWSQPVIRGQILFLPRAIIKVITWHLAASA